MLENLNLIEKLINEHGSAKILKERLKLAADEFSALERKIPELESKISVLQDENKTLRSNLQDATKKISTLEKRIQTFDKQQSSEKLDDITENILKSFFESDDGLTMEHFISSLEQSRNIMEYHFDILLEKDFIEYSSSGFVMGAYENSSPSLYNITPNGTKYVLKYLGA